MKVCIRLLRMEPMNPKKGRENLPGTPRNQITNIISGHKLDIDFAASQDASVSTMGRCSAFYVVAFEKSASVQRRKHEYQY
jgi:hypothetical protein